MRYMRSGAYGVCMINNNEEGTSRGFMLSFELHLTAYLCYPIFIPFSTDVHPLLTLFSPAFHAPFVTAICYVYAIMRQLLGILRLSDSRCPPDRNKYPKKAEKSECKNIEKSKESSLHMYA